MSLLKSLKTRYNTLKSIKIQNSYNTSELEKADKLIVFFIPDREGVNGGVMSIFSLCRYSRQLNPSALTLLCTFPSSKTYNCNHLFLNNEKIWRFSQIIKFSQPKEMIIHIPEYLVSKFMKRLSQKSIKWLRNVPSLHINIMNQNIMSMPPRDAWQNLFSLTSHITQTTAHDKYASQEICDRYGIPLHHFSCFIDSGQVKRYSFEEKEKIIVFSPDAEEADFKLHVRQEIEKGLPEYKIITVQNMTFTQYIDLVSKSFAVITFGEGMDDYFNRPPVLGSMGFAVYNEEFFPSQEWKKLKNIYHSYDDMQKYIVKDIKAYEENKASYYADIELHNRFLSQLYSFTSFKDNLKRFYQGKYDLYPT